MQSMESNENRQRETNRPGYNTIDPQNVNNLSNNFNSNNSNFSRSNQSLNLSSFNYPSETRNSLGFNNNTTNYNNGSISSYINQDNHNINKYNSYYSQPLVNTMQANVLKNNNVTTSILKVNGLSNGSTTTTATSQQVTHLTNNTTRNNISLNAIHPHFVITNSANSLPNNTTLAKGSTTVMAGKGPQTLLLTTKDGQQTTMVVQQQPSQVTVSDCNVLNSSNPQVITINKPITQTSTLNQQQPQQITQLAQLVSNTQGIIPTNMVLNMNTSRQVGPTTFVNTSTAQRGLQPRVLLNNAPLRLSPQMIQRPGTPNVMNQNISLPANLRGAILLKTDNGQFQFVNVGSIPTSSQNILHQTYRFQVPASTSTTATTVQQQNVSTIRPLAQQLVTLPASMTSNIHRTTVITQQPTQSSQNTRLAPQQINQPLTIQTTTVNTQATTVASSQMSPNTAKRKCKNFLSTLIKLANEQPENVGNVAVNVKNLIQGLIDGQIQPEGFTVQLQRELNSSPQPCLIPFLKKSLPYLRHSLMIKEMTIDGINPPPQGTIPMPVQHLTFQSKNATGTTVRFVASNTSTATNQNTIPNKPITTKQVQKYQKSTLSVTSTGASSINTSSVVKTASSAKKKDYVSKTKTIAPKEKKEKKNKEDKETFSSSLRDDDDINDVAAMGGVNLLEEHQRILATNAEFVGAQIRSCKDEPFLSINPLLDRINKIATKYNLEEVSIDVVALVSHAAQELLKTLVEKLGIIAEHRIENLKMDHRYEITQDVRSQIKFLDELDKIEKKRHLEQEREMLMKAAKSRSKAEDPEQLKLKQKAKEMQRAELEEARQREANETALLAIGPRKKMKSGHLFSNTNLTYNNSSNNSSLNFTNNNLNKQQIRRVKRVNLRDLQFLMEQEKETVRTPMLFKAYSK